MRTRILQHLRQSLVLTLLGIMVVAAGVQACCRGDDGYSPPTEHNE